LFLIVLSPGLYILLLSVLLVFPTNQCHCPISLIPCYGDFLACLVLAVGATGTLWPIGILVMTPVSKVSEFTIMWWLLIGYIPQVKDRRREALNWEPICSDSYEMRYTR
jgi:hypothetical protein